MFIATFGYSSYKSINIQNSYPDYKSHKEFPDVRTVVFTNSFPSFYVYGT